MMPGQVDIGYNMPLGRGNLDISARRDINKQRPGVPQNYAANINYNMKFADGGAVQMSPQDMLAELIYGGQTPQHFALGSQVENINPAQPTQSNTMAPGLGVLPFLKSYQT
jgi:hypothetical protein